MTCVLDGRLSETLVPMTHRPPHRRWGPETSAIDATVELESGAVLFLA